MATIRGRVDKLERRAGVTGGPWCECPGPLQVVWDDGAPVAPFCGPWPEKAPEPPPEVCERCGKPIRVIVVTWDDGGLLDEREE